MSKAYRGTRCVEALGQPAGGRWPAVGGGCTAGSPPVALEQARTAYAQAEQTPAVVTNAPVPLQEANQALQRA